MELSLQESKDKIDFEFNKIQIKNSKQLHISKFQNIYNSLTQIDSNWSWVLQYSKSVFMDNSKLNNDDYTLLMDSFETRINQINARSLQLESFFETLENSKFKKSLMESKQIHQFRIFGFETLGFIKNQYIQIINETDNKKSIDILLTCNDLLSFQYSDFIHYSIGNIFDIAETINTSRLVSNSNKRLYNRHIRNWVRSTDSLHELSKDFPSLLQSKIYFISLHEILFHLKQNRHEEIINYYDLNRVYGKNFVDVCKLVIGNETIVDSLDVTFDRFLFLFECNSKIYNYL